MIGYHFVANTNEIRRNNIEKETLERLQANQANIPNRVGDTIYIIRIYPMKEDFDFLQDKFTQIIGYEVENVEELPDGAISHTMPSGNYASYTHKGTERNVINQLGYIYGEWLKENRLIPLGYDMECWEPEDVLSGEAEMYIATIML